MEETDQNIQFTNKYQQPRTPEKNKDNKTSKCWVKWGISNDNTTPDNLLRGGEKIANLS